MLTALGRQTRQNVGIDRAYIAEGKRLPAADGRDKLHLYRPGRHIERNLVRRIAVSGKCIAIFTVTLSLSFTAELPVAVITRVLSGSEAETGDRKRPAGSLHTRKAVLLSDIVQNLREFFGHAGFCCRVELSVNIQIPVVVHFGEAEAVLRREIKIINNHNGLFLGDFTVPQ